jgi:hypothetical protein
VCGVHVVIISKHFTFQTHLHIYTQDLTRDLSPRELVKHMETYFTSFVPNNPKFHQFINHVPFRPISKESQVCVCVCVCV